MISTVPKWVGDLFSGMLRPNTTVLETDFLSPFVKRIRFKSDISNTRFEIGYANVVRVSDTEYRNYTTSRYDKTTGEFEMIIHLHGNGTGERYLDALQKGDQLYIGPARGKRLHTPDATQHFVFGDETTLGLACSFLPVLKESGRPFQFYFELDEANREVPALLALENYTIFPKNGSFRNEEWLDTLPVCTAFDWRNAAFSLAGNAKSVQTFRKVLKTRQGGSILTQGYWLEGKKGL